MTTRTGDAEDSEGISPRTPSPPGLALHSQGHPVRPGGSERARNEAASGGWGEGQEGPGDRLPLLLPPGRAGSCRCSDHCAGGGGGEGRRGPGESVTSTSRTMVGFGHIPFCRLLLSLGSQGRGRGTAGHPRVMMPGNNGCVFNAGQNGFRGWLPVTGRSVFGSGACPLPAQRLCRSSTRGMKAGGWVQGLLQAGCLRVPPKAGRQRESRARGGLTRGPRPCRHLALGTALCVSQAPPRTEGLEAPGASPELGAQAWLEGRGLERGAGTSQGALPMGTRAAWAVGRWHQPTEVPIAGGQPRPRSPEVTLPPIPTGAPPEVLGRLWGAVSGRAHFRVVVLTPALLCPGGWQDTKTEGMGTGLRGWVRTPSRPPHLQSQPLPA